MSATQDKGQRAERAALHWLLEQGYELVEQNYRHGHGEIDFIVERPGLLVFVEVKFRKSTAFGYPEEFVTINQRRSIIRTAEQYIAAIHWQGMIRFDIIALDPSGQIEHFEDAFY